ncbi:probable phosphorylase b kinase regulatory subunit alpha [Ornithodoros turicata]|uniref:Phosphorylase b kinase regulatory subunit n=1 Tax=Ornithodoros turicata TaxID=34597 RepID=A0A2R5L667_9ACAR
MRSRSNSSVRLDYYQRLICKTILNFQDPVTGMIPSQKYDNHAWVRDNVYSILSVWALSMAYKKNAELDEDRAKTYELEQSCVKLMRGLLIAMMKQKDKIEKFKESPSPSDCLHAKYNSVTGDICVGDNEWGHLQIDATSLYLLVLAQMTASGIQIVFNLDEVAFVQNLVFYIESAYCIPDYGIWERGDKTNHGLPELNGSSIGAAKAALEAMNELDLFGGRGGPSSVIHVLADEAQKCDAVLHSMLPRESNSKEVDAALMTVIGFPAFAVTDPDLIELTRSTIVEKLQGQYGCKRFLRDGYKTAKEDSNRLYYEPWELQVFENIECEWPIFFCYMVIDACFRGDRNTVDEYMEMLDRIVIKTDEGLKYVPEMYAVPDDKVELEYESPHSQVRVPIGQIPFMWAQSLYVIGKLLHDGLIAPGELDPLNRRLGSQKKPDVVVQVVLLAEDSDVQEKLMSLSTEIQTIAEVSPIEVQPARVLGNIYSYLGYSKKMGLSGRFSKDVGLLSTSKLYTLQDRIFAFTPQNLDSEEFHLVNDIDLFASTLRSDVAVLRSNWNMLGRPTMVVIIHAKQLEMGKVPMALKTAIKKLKSGYIHGTRVTLGTLNDFLSTSCVASLSFLNNQEEGDPDSLHAQVRDYLDKEMRRAYLNRPGALSKMVPLKSGLPSSRSRKSGIAGMIRRSRSFQLDSTDHDSPYLSANVSAVTSRRNSSSDDEFDGAPIRAVSELQLDHVTEWELLTTFKETESLEEQGDILHYLATHKGLTWDTGLGQPHSIVTVKDLFQDFYERACQEKKWGLVRHFAGSLGKRVEDLAKSMTDLLVRQKQVTVGMPPQNEYTITRPLSTKELRTIINRAHRGDQSTAMLTQEIVVYLGMFIHTEPELFHEMLRLRVGLIIQVMASELARSIQCPAEDATDILLGLSPFEMKTLLRNILSGQEFTVKNMESGIVSVSSSFVSKRSAADTFLKSESEDEDTLVTVEKQGQWIRRRRLDGALNRVPMGFYPRVWSILERCQGLSIEGRTLLQTLTKEMTPGELKFALQVEQVLNCIPEPEYRQLIVEAIMVLSLAVEHDAVSTFGGFMNIESLVQMANTLFLEDQKELCGNATLCCAATKATVPCRPTANICQHFYDSAPSGCYGTMTYLVRAVASSLHDIPQHELDCTMS